MDELAKQSSESGIVKRDTAKERLQLSAVMQALERDHRTEFSNQEIAQWESLLEHPEKFSLAEIMAALDEVQLNPPDGWTGPPKRTDVLRQMFRNREARAEEIKRNGGISLADKDCSVCKGSGWKQVPQGQSNVMKVTRCDCWLRNREKTA